MTYDFEGGWSSHAGFNSALHAPAGATQLTYVDKVIKALKEEHGMDDAMLAKTSIGAGFYGRSQGNVAGGLDPSDIPGSPSSGSGGGGTIEKGVFSYFDLYENYIGKEGKGINGWKNYFYPEYAGDILYN